MFALDLCAGRKTATAAMRDRGWQVITVDIDPDLNPDILADVRAWSWKGKRPDLIWSSPPCEEFSREFLPWSHTGKTPDLSVYQACRRIVNETRPTYWVIENVRGAVRYFGPYTAVYYPFYLWGFFPPLGDLRFNRKFKKSYTSSRSAERAQIPYELSKALARAVEYSLPLLSPEVRNG
jgi:hypothetical protein